MTEQESDYNDAFARFVQHETGGHPVGSMELWQLHEAFAEKWADREWANWETGENE